MSESVTICGLFFGDHPDIAARCLGSLRKTLSESCPVCDIRFALNAVSDATWELVSSWAAGVSRDFQIPCRVVWSPSDDGSGSMANRLKYPMMRRLFRQNDRPLGDLVMWFDDDTWWDSKITPAWWAAVLSACRGVEMLGQLWRFPLPSQRQAFFRRQAWFDPAKQVRRHLGQPVTWFFQGAWWVARSEFLLRYDWPSPDLRHNGGDSMLGELIYHQDIPVRVFDSLVHINADASGRKSSAKRRGFSERPLGFTVSVAENRPVDFPVSTADF